MQTRYPCDGGKQSHIGDGAHHQIDDEQFLRNTGKLLPVVPHFCTGPDAIGGDAQLGKHGKIGDQGGGKGHLAGSLREQDPGNIGEGDQRKQKR